MTIRSIESFTNNLWDWGILDGCFGKTKIKPTDIDGCIERNGRALFLEAKSVGVPLKMAQEITFKNLSKAGNISAIVVWGSPGKPEEMMVFYKGKSTGKQKIDMHGFREKVSSWYKWADKQRCK